MRAPLAGYIGTRGRSASIAAATCKEIYGGLRHHRHHLTCVGSGRSETTAIFLDIGAAIMGEEGPGWSIMPGS